MSAPSRRGETPRYREGVGIVLVNARKLVFVARRIDMKQAWQMPQGGIDAGEAPQAAARRELEEETGVVSATVMAQTPGWLSYDLPAHLAARRWQGRYRGQRQLWFAMRFDGSDDEIDLGRARHPEFDAWRWATPAAAMAGAVDFKRDLYRQVLGQFAALLA